MASTRIEHEFDCTEATFWQMTFFDQEFNRRLYLFAFSHGGNPA